VSDTIFACVGENDVTWLPALENLVLSLRCFGGALAGSPFVVHLVGGANRVITERLARYDVEIRVVAPVEPRKPSSNKLRMLELAEAHQFDTLVMLDHDTIVMGDLTEVVGDPALRALPAGMAPIDAVQWESLYAAAGLDVPTHRTTMVRTGVETMPYYNSGVLFVPARTCGPLREQWLHHLTWMLDGGAARAGMEGLSKDQIPLSLALASTGIRVRQLPVNLNLSTTQHRASRPYRHQWGPPFIFHYHRQLDSDGFVLPSPWRAVNPWLDRFNLRRAKQLGIAYRGLGRVPLRVRLGAIRKARRATIGASGGRKGALGGLR
jgi:hypothetical protein